MFVCFDDDGLRCVKWLIVGGNIEMRSLNLTLTQNLSSRSQNLTRDNHDLKAIRVTRRKMANVLNEA